MKGVCGCENQAKLNERLPATQSRAFEDPEPISFFIFHSCNAFKKNQILFLRENKFVRILLIPLTVVNHATICKTSIMIKQTPLMAGLAIAMLTASCTKPGAADSSSISTPATAAESIFADGSNARTMIMAVQPSNKEPLAPAAHRPSYRLTPANSSAAHSAALPSP
jgi:hypothetical protein